ncbi:MAG TPA: S1C family serine protease [Planctomycetota bacterium]|nr:S1C family serine protease [Planctomycetota bacterium]
MTVRLVLLSLLATALCGLDAPDGVIAVVDPEPATSRGEGLLSTACGGAAVVIGDGLALTLDEVVPAGVDRVSIVLQGGLRRTARVERRGTTTGAILLRLDAAGAPRALELADSAKLALGDPVWSVGNSFGVIEQDGVAALSKGIVSGFDEIPSDAPPVRGRLGRVLTTYRGPVIETDAAANDGNQGGPLLDDAGRVLGLISLGLARERRLGTVVPIHLVVRDLGLDLPLAAPAGASDANAARLARAAAAAAPAVVLLYLERPNGLGNPVGIPRPPLLTDETPLYERERLARHWDRYYHQQQVLYTDQPVSGIVVGRDLVLTSASNLHGIDVDAVAAPAAADGIMDLPWSEPKDVAPATRTTGAAAGRGRVLIHGAPAVEAQLVGFDLALDLALFRTTTDMAVTPAVLAGDAAIAVGDGVALVGRHRVGGEHTLTTGVISAATRRRDQNDLTMGQIDALANYGNLGGAVVDAEGAVVGMVAMLGPREDWPWLINSGVALFTPSAAIRDALPALERGKRLDEKPGFGLGVRLQHDRLGGRLVVIELVLGMGAADGGVLAGDVLLSVDGKDARTHQAVTRALIPHQAGDRVVVRVRRGDQEIDLDVELKAFE